MVTKRAQTRQLNKTKKIWTEAQTSQGLNSSSAEKNTPNLIPGISFNQGNLNELPPELQNLSPEEQLQALELMSQMQESESQQQSSSQKRLRALPKNLQNPPTSSGESGTDEPPEDDLTAPLTGKHLKQEKELKSVLGAIVLGLSAASKASQSKTLMLDAHTVANYGEEVAHTWAVLGRKYAWVYDFLDKVCAGSFVAVALAPMSAMLGEIANNHGVEIPLIGKKSAAA